MAIGFIGLGNLGSAMARRLMSEGEQLLVWNRTSKKAEDLGAEVAETPADLINQVQVVFLNLFDSDAVEDVMFGEAGLFEGHCEGKLIIDTTTNDSLRVGSFHDMAAEQGVKYLEVPVAGSVVPASQGNLMVLASGEEDAFEQARPYLKKIGKTIHYLPTPGQATRMKLVNNLLLGTFMVGIAEAVALGERAGLDRSQLIDILAGGAGKSLVMDAKKQKLLDRDFSAHFAAKAIYKDLHYLQDLVRELQRPLFSGSIAKEIFGMAAARGWEDEDFSVVYRVFSEINK